MSMYYDSICREILVELAVVSRYTLLGLGKFMRLFSNVKGTDCIS